MVEILKDRALMFSADDGFWIAVNDEGTGPYLTDGLFTLTEGENYTIVINGTKYTGKAVTATVTGMGEVVGIGNADALTGGAGNGEPYAAGFAPAGADASTFILAWLDTATAAEAYTVSLYEGVEEEEPDTPAEEETSGANIVLYDRNGNPVTYEGIETVSFNTAEGDVATYTHGTATDEVAVALDLSAGNQTVTPAEADFMKTVVIEKPDTLLPENIKRGVEIAGVAGELIGEGVSKEVALSLADGDQTVEADPETLMSEVIIKKPETLLPENIAKDVEIAGVVGTMLGDDGWGLTDGYSYADSENYASGTLIMGESGTYSLTLEFPADATDIYFLGRFRPSAIKSDGSSLKSFFDEDLVVVNPNDFIVTQRENGRKGIKFFSKDYSYSGAYALRVNVSYTVLYTMPNVKIEGGVLYANPACEGIFIGGSTNLSHPFYMETVDLRGSNIKLLPTGSFSARPETKKIWLPENLTVINGGAFATYNNWPCALEEIHFTSTTPPTVKSASAFTGVPTTCKLYVPAGALDAYTSAANYPSASNYTYIEE